MALQARVARRFDSFQLDVELEVAEGETLVVVGDSGAGKSTLLRVLAGLESPDAGTIRLGTETYTDLPAWRRSIGFVPQDYLLFPHLTVFENVAFGLRAQSRAREDIGRRVDTVLGQLEIGALAARLPRHISGGQQQRVALARALVLEPALLLLDEPLSTLDLRTRQAVRAELRALLATLSCATVLVTHHPVDAMVFGDRIAALENGRFTQVGTREDLLRHPRSRYVAAFLGVNLFQGPIVGRESGTARVRTEHGEVSVVDPGGEGEVFAVVNPRDITLFRERPGGSARNSFQGKIVELAPEPPNGERVRVAIGSRPPLVAEVTEQAVASLGLREGGEVYASFKATSVEVFR